MQDSVRLTDSTAIASPEVSVYESMRRLAEGGTSVVLPKPVCWPVEAIPQEVIDKITVAVIPASTSMRAIPYSIWGPVLASYVTSWLRLLGRRVE